jgi:hypothetical protein
MIKTALTHFFGEQMMFVLPYNIIKYNCLVLDISEFFCEKLNKGNVIYAILAHRF